MPDKPWNIKDAFLELLANYIRENDFIPGVESVDKVVTNSEGNLEDYVEIYYTDIDGNEHIHTFSGSLEVLLGI